MKGYWVYAALLAVLVLTGLTVKEPVFWLLPFAYVWWLSSYLPRPVLYMSAVLIMLIAAHYIMLERQNSTSLSPSQHSFEGRIASIPDFNGQTLSFTFQLSNEAVAGAYLLPTIEKKNELQRLKPGFTCKVEGTLVKPEPSRNEGAFNYERYLHHQKIHWVLQISDLSIRRCSDDYQVRDMFQRWRDRGIRFIEGNVPQPSSGMMQALIYGERRNISEETLGDYQEGGIIHLLAISGLHVGFLTGGAFYLLIRAGVTRENAILSLLLVLPFYGLIAGAAPSVVRAVMMTELMLAVLLMKRSLTPQDAVSAAFLLMAGINPYYIYHVGFQLSFVVSFSLIMSARLMENRAVPPLLAASIVSQLSSLPLILYHFHTISILSLPLNLLFIPLFSIIVLPVCMVILCLLIMAPPLGEVLSMPLNLLLNVSNRLVEFAVSFPHTQLVFGRPFLCVPVILFAGVLWFFKAGEHGGKQWRWSCICLALLMVVVYYQFHLNPKGRITVIDVGQGDSILIELPYRKGIYLIDTGGSIPFEKETWQKKRSSFDVGKDILIPFLHERGIRKIDKLLITHGDYDHAGAAVSLLNAVEVEELVIGKKASLNELERKIVKHAASRGIRVVQAAKGARWKEGEFAFDVLAPEGNEESKNDQSLVLYTRLGGTSWLFTGDLEQEGEERLVKNYPHLSVDVLKVGHHGSQTSTSSFLLDHIKPKAAVISAGKRNRYGHPHPSVIKELKSRGIPIFRTDQNGAVHYSFWKNNGTFCRQIP
jgi:competence protein ComEC